MKIKELFKKIENANEVAKQLNEKYVLQFTTDTGISPAEFSTYDEFADGKAVTYRFFYRHNNLNRKQICRGII